MCKRRRGGAKKGKKSENWWNNKRMIKKWKRVRIKYTLKSIRRVQHKLSRSWNQLFSFYIKDLFEFFNNVILEK